MLFVLSEKGMPIPFKRPLYLKVPLPGVEPGRFRTGFKPAGWTSSPTRVYYLLVEPPGFEPGKPGCKPSMIPFHHSPIILLNI